MQMLIWESDTLLPRSILLVDPSPKPGLFWCGLKGKREKTLTSRLII